MLAGLAFADDGPLRNRQESVDHRSLAFAVAEDVEGGARVGTRQCRVVCIGAGIPSRAHASGLKPVGHAFRLRARDFQAELVGTAECPDDAEIQVPPLVHRLGEGRGKDTVRRFPNRRVPDQHGPTEGVVGIGGGNGNQAAYLRVVCLVRLAFRIGQVRVHAQVVRQVLLDVDGERVRGRLLAVVWQERFVGVRRRLAARELDEILHRRAHAAVVRRQLIARCVAHTPEQRGRPRGRFEFADDAGWPVVKLRRSNSGPSLGRKSRVVRPVLLLVIGSEVSRDTMAVMLPLPQA